jgi:hypothetical protein
MRDAVETGELSATRGERAYIEGALDALDGLLGERRTHYNGPGSDHPGNRTASTDAGSGI